MTMFEYGVSCPVCEGTVPQAASGPMRVTCSPRCRKRLHGWRTHRDEKSLWVEFWKTQPGADAKSAVAKLERQLAVLAVLDDRRRSS